jgi:16S rRNA (cytidine1402-2'-O)-methyltransferase
VEAGLYIVATPIGNLGDITQRALEVLGGADLIAAEDTRHTQRLLQHFGIQTRVTAYHDHSDGRAIQRIADVLAGGGRVALVSDAGTPLISDPGYRLVRDLQDAGHRVIPVPGACAAIAALSVCGLPTDRFHFEGFLPARAGQRVRRLTELAALESTLVFYEAPHRVAEALADMVAVLGEAREATLAREVTKAFETVRRGTLNDLAELVADDDNQRRGEIVLVVSGCEPAESELDARTLALLCRLGEELPARTAAAVVAEYSGLRKNALYQALLAQRGAD